MWSVSDILTYITYMQRRRKNSPTKVHKIELMNTKKNREEKRNRTMHIFSSSSSPPFFLPSQSQGPLLPYTHTKQKDGDTLHLIFHPLFIYALISVCLIRKKKNIYIYKEQKKRRRRRICFVPFVFSMN
jgi:hypothetical protein